MKKTNKTTLMLFALVLSLSVTVGATLAYFSDYEQASGGATLNLGGKTELTEGSDTGKKDVVIKNTGKTNMIVRVGIFGPDEMKDPTVNTDKWILGPESNREESKYYYYYRYVLKPGDEQHPGDGDDTGEGNLVASMTFDWQLQQGEEPPDYYFEVTVVHEGAQAIYYYDDEGNEHLTVPDGWNPTAVGQIKFPVNQSPANE